ncbi:peroxide stress protein YaaA [Sinanaerobacter sp. ZZT-01]|uniref:peroxide stress protein YaaA n=1 Tax=Sinanaerobacter sp. ZZT-01 TaxID=3111540 RepID=UPI002D792FB8|nr:peroxide stress protein YaaA [Sinanaerobacter sp. ZZT-01]WRR93344.1 peroxide stress protein YaaA [Sinanaerobacter sp. ZZT-01]
MKIIISPAKKMKRETDSLEVRNLPAFLEKTKYLMDYLKSLTYEEAKTLWKCNDSIAQLNYERLKAMDLQRNLTPALLAYEGIQYQYMAPSVFEDTHWDYIEEHLYILSGFYGMVKPFDGIVPYRLEMQTRVVLEDYKNLYDFWGSHIYEKMKGETDCIVNLASKEYSKCIEAYLSDEVNFITCIFGEYKNGKVIEKGTQVKMARGEMVRYMAENNIKDLSQLIKFDRLGYHYTNKFSNEKKLVFIKE